MATRLDNRKKLDYILKGKGLQPIDRSYKANGEVSILFAGLAQVNQVRAKLISLRIACEQKGMRLTVWLDEVEETYKA
jgi:hypothetical protein